MEDSHKSNTSETAIQSGSTVQAAHISHIAQQVSSLSESEESQDSSDSVGSSQKTHGILARCPSYRKILKDLSSEDTRGRKGDRENPGVSGVTSMSVPTPRYQTSTGQYIVIRIPYMRDLVTEDKVEKDLKEVTGITGSSVKN
uniref:KID domain-containing protein n=1 Tax=Moschus moschiferus TaxID=68415 RepID=A0A8C6CZH4_MOSMO